MTKTRGRESRSRLISTMLAGAWRSQPPAPDISSEQIAFIAPLLIGSGGGALAFWKLRGTELANTAVGDDLKQCYRLYTLQAAIHELEIKAVIALLSKAGIEPILVKGWSIARHFPEPALRPYGDIDLFVRPEDFEQAQQVLAGEEGKKYFVDLHLGSEHLCDQPFEDLWRRSETVKLDGTSVRVLSVEDHLRILCVHFLHHGAWRPAGLCDIGLLVEKFGSKLDWKTCLTANPTRASWIECTIRLANRQLDADLTSTPFENSTKRMPRWLVPAVLREWNNPVSLEHVVPPPLIDRIRHPLETFKAIRRRWPPNPIQATVVMEGKFNDWPRLIYQAENFLARTARFLRARNKM